jgi:hypothetical protein
LKAVASLAGSLVADIVKGKLLRALVGSRDEALWGASAEDKVGLVGAMRRFVKAAPFTGALRPAVVVKSV